MILAPPLLKSMRQRANLTQSEAANAAGVSLRCWQNWEAPVNSTNNRQLPCLQLPIVLKVLRQISHIDNGNIIIHGFEDDLHWIPIQSVLKQIRLRLKMSWDAAAETVHYQGYSWHAWELPPSHHRARKMHPSVGELFAIHNNIPYRILSGEVLIPETYLYT